MDKTKLIRTIYLYLFSLVGLVLVIISGVRFIDMGLKAWVFTKAEVYERQMPSAIKTYPEATSDVELAKKMMACDQTCNLTEQEKQVLKDWVAEYSAWESQQQSIDYVTQTRHRDAASALAQLIVGLPLYLYHWRLATRSRKDDDIV